jgi:hypothetical protein
MYAFHLTAGTEVIFAGLGHFTASSIRVCATNDSPMDLEHALILWVILSMDRTF